MKSTKILITHIENYCLLLHCFATLSYLFVQHGCLLLVPARNPSANIKCQDSVIKLGFKYDTEYAIQDKQKQTQTWLHINHLLPL